MARPTRSESLRRKLEFLELVAQGVPVDLAAHVARVDPARALAIIGRPEEFVRIVVELRQEEAA
jgi:hypothetical protein